MAGEIVSFNWKSQNSKTRNSSTVKCFATNSNRYNWSSWDLITTAFPTGIQNAATKKWQVVLGTVSNFYRYLKFGADTQRKSRENFNLGEEFRHVYNTARSRHNSMYFVYLERSLLGKPCGPNISHTVTVMFDLYSGLFLVFKLVLFSTIPKPFWQ